MRPIPEDFATNARGMGVSEAARHYNACTRTIRLWASACGDGLHEAMIANGRHASIMAGKMTTKARTKIVPLSRDSLTQEQEAMRFLQRKMRWVCYSSRIHEGESKDVYYNVGNRKLTSDELFDLAKRYGFQE